MNYEAIGLETKTVYATGTHADCSRAVNHLVSDKRLYRPDERSYGTIRHRETIRIVPIGCEVDIDSEQKRSLDDAPEQPTFRGWTDEQMDLAIKNIRKPNKEIMLLLVQEFGESIDLGSFKDRMSRLRSSLNQGRRRWTVDDENFVIKNHEKMTYRQMGEYLGRSESAMTNYVHKLRERRLI